MVALFLESQQHWYASHCELTRTIRGEEVERVKREREREEEN